MIDDQREVSDLTRTELDYQTINLDSLRLFTSPTGGKFHRVPECSSTGTHPSLDGGESLFDGVDLITVGDLLDAADDPRDRLCRNCASGVVEALEERGKA